MKKINKIKVVAVILLILCIVAVIRVVTLPDFLVYNEDNRTIYGKGTQDIVLDEIIHSEMIGQDKIIGIFTEPEPYVGIYDIVAESTETVCAIEMLSEALERTVVPEEIRNVQLIDSDSRAISFLYQQTLYKYDEQGEIHVIWEFTGPMAEKPYAWLSESKVLLLDDAEILNDWKLLLLDMETGEVNTLDTAVSAFVVSADGILYGKKYYMGAWCEWELHFLNFRMKQVREPIRNSFWSIGQILCGADDEIYILPDKSGVIDEKETEVFRLGHFGVCKYKVGKIGGNEQLLRVE